MQWSDEKGVRDWSRDQPAREEQLWMKVKLQLDLKKGFRELERRGGRGKEECVFF